MLQLVYLFFEGEIAAIFLILPTRQNPHWHQYEQGRIQNDPVHNVIFCFTTCLIQFKIIISITMVKLNPKLQQAGNFLS